MSAGIPIIASNFSLWREIVNRIGCGILVDPLDPVAIAKGIEWLLDHPEKAKVMGENGRQAVATRYNWVPEGQKLTSLYQKLWGHS
jgi:glycosyltransferase involved in cell wall biosynthesis